MIEKLIKIQSELKAPKGQLNKFGNYRYRSCEDIIEAVKPLLAREGLAMTINDYMVNIGERYYVQATVTLHDKELKEETRTEILAKHETHVGISVTAYAREEEVKKGMDAAQITGAASSYARKYALNGMFAIDDTKDADSTNTHGKEKDIQIDEPPAGSEDELEAEAKPW